VEEAVAAELCARAEIDTSKQIAVQTVTRSLGPAIRGLRWKFIIRD
jgi:hypothetical protein